MNTFNLATYQYTDKRVAAFWLFFLFALALIFSFYNVYTYKTTLTKLDQSSVGMERLQGDVSALKKDLQEKTGQIGARGERHAEKLKEKIDWLNEIIGRKRFSWSELLYSLENASPPKISIDSIKPSYSGKKIRIAGQGKTVDAVTLLVDRLKESEYMRKCLLLKEELVPVEKIYQAIAFDIECDGKF